MNIFSIYRDHIEAVIGKLIEAGGLPRGLDTSHLTAEPPRDPSHGDISTNAAMLLAKPAGLKPRDIAEMIAARLREVGGVTGVEIAGPGFINMRLGDSIWHDCLKLAIRHGADFGGSKHGAGRKVNVEYVSANPTGPLHIGHARGTVFGDVLAALLEKAGYDVTREFYINDAGGQVDSLAWAAYWRYLQALGANVSEETISGFIPSGTLEYRGEYLIPVGKALAEKYGESLACRDEATGELDGEAISQWLPVVRKFTVDAMMALIRADLAALGVHQDVFISERKLVEDGMVEDVLQTLESMDHIYTGVLEPPKGKTLQDWEPRPQTLFRATDFGDDVDRPLKKSDGSWTYFASDIANHLDKFRRGFAEMIDVWGADHAGYVKRMQAAVTAISAGEAELDVKICQIVRLMDGGAPVKMSKRAGTFVTLRDLVDEVGPDVVRFHMLTRKNDTQMDFDLAVLTEKSRDNPVWYVQYASARCRSSRREALKHFPNHDISLQALSSNPISCLTDESELGLIKMIAGWPRLVEAAADAHEPHRIAFYLYELAALLHAFWETGKKNPGFRIVQEDNEKLTMARLVLVQGVQTVIDSGLGIFGIEPVEEMR